MTSPIDRLLSVAISQLGTTESPAGTNLQKYGAWYGTNGVPWCDQFVSWVADQAGLSDAIGKSEYVPGRLAQARTAGQVRMVPIPGALVCYDWDGNGVADHIGIVEKVTGASTFDAIEGNTSPDDHGSQSNGGGVFRRHRAIQQVAGFIYPPILEDPMPLTQADADLVALAVLKRFASWTPPTGEDPLPNWQTVVTRDHATIAKILTATTKPPTLDVAALATALAKLLPAGAGIDPKALATAVVAELSSRLTR